jgi:hypothetical protein
MMTPEQIAKAIAKEKQRQVNAADRPRIRALEIERTSAPDYYSVQPGQPPGKWTVDGTLVKPDEPPSDYIKKILVL